MNYLSYKKLSTQSPRQFGFEGIIQSLNLVINITVGAPVIIAPRDGREFRHPGRVPELRNRSIYSKTPAVSVRSPTNSPTHQGKWWKGAAGDFFGKTAIHWFGNVVWNVLKELQFVQILNSQSLTLISLTPIIFR